MAASEPADPTLEVVARLAERLLGPARYSAEELAAAVGISVDDIEPTWMELGFAPVDRDQRLFTDADLETLRLFLAAQDHELVGTDMAIALARVLGQALARLAATEAQALAPLVAELAERRRPVSEPPAHPTLDAPVTLATADDLVDLAADVLVPTIDRFMAYSWRRHLLSALHRHLAPRTAEVVGFADLVGFTALSAQLDPEALPDVVGRFQELATQHLVTRGGRVVKTIGDAVLFVFSDGPAAALGALGLVDACRADASLPPVRVGLACGPVVELEGDLYGETVNRAARLVELARSGTVLADDDTALQCLDRPELAVRPLRPRRLKGLGLVRVWAVRFGWPAAD
jgi:adenylate cyclase